MDDHRSWLDACGYFGNLAFACNRVAKGRRAPSDRVFLSTAGNDLGDYLDGTREVEVDPNADKPFRGVYALYVLLTAEAGDGNHEIFEGLDLASVEEDLLSAKDLDVFSEKAEHYSALFYELSNIAEEKCALETHFYASDTKIISLNHGRRVNANQS